jgi:hypothetical protein
MEIEKTISLIGRIADFRSAEEAFGQIKEKEDKNVMILLFAAGALYSALMSSLVGIFTVFTERFQFISAGVDVPEIALDLDLILPFLSYNLVFVAPVGLIGTFVSQTLIFIVLRATGGKGTLMNQLYCYSFLYFLLSLSSTILILSLFVCLGWLIMIPFILFTLIYVQIYLQSMMLSVVHDISMAHAAFVIMVMAIVGLGLPYIIGLLIMDAGFVPPTIESVLGVEYPERGEISAV